MKELNNKKGISLIVLVITIIVMIILAAAIILSLQSSGIIGRANEAKVSSDVANAKQIVAMANAEWELMESTKKSEYLNSFAKYAETKIKDAGYKTGIGTNTYIVTEEGRLISAGENTIYKDENDLYVVIPKGFIVSTVSTEDTVEEGLVIYKTDEKITDTNVLSAQTEYDQFVWIPVDEEFDRINWQNDDYFDDIKEPYDLEEYINMKESIEKYGGFYIGRYEAGTNVEREEGKENGTTEVVIRKNKYVYNCVGWGPRKNVTVGNVIDYEDYNQGMGAVELSRNIYKDLTSVESTLCYGIQWDAALKFISQKYSDYPINSSNKGNYEKTLMNTGTNENYSVNNIYDMAGNVYEWTMEYYTAGGCVQRGGNFVGNGINYPASIRCDGDPREAIDAYGFRIALYLN